MSKKSYYELLKDPRWQKKRLEVLESRNWECENCGSKDSTLHVHHGAYLKGMKPWEYPYEMLHCYCESCHEEAGIVDEEFKRVYGTMNFESIRMLQMIAEADSDHLSYGAVYRAIMAFCNITNFDDRVLAPLVEYMRLAMGGPPKVPQNNSDDEVAF